MKYQKLFNSFKKNKLISVISLIFILYFCWIYYISQNYYAFIKPNDIQNIINGNSFVFKNNPSGKLVEVVIISEHSYSVDSLSELLNQSHNIKLTTPKSMPKNEQGVVRAYVHIDGKPL